MLTYALFFSYLCLCLGFMLGFIRLIKGPSTLDRILAFDYLSACIICFIALYSIDSGSISYLELILIFGLLGFATVISFMEIYFYREKQNG